MPNVLVMSASDLIITAFQSVFATLSVQASYSYTLTEQQLVQPKPDILFLDDSIIQDVGSAMTHIRKLQECYPKLKIVIVSMYHEPAYVWKWVEAGANGYLYLRDRLVPRIPLLIEDVAKGNLYISPTAQTALASIRYYRELHLTEYQAAVLRLMAQHYTASRIATELGRSTAAIYQVQKLLREIFVVETNNQLVQKVVELQLLEI